MNPAVIDELYLIPEYEDFSAEINKLLRETDPLRILLLVDYKIEFGIQIKDGTASPYMYGAHSLSNLDAFINTAYMMLRDGAENDNQINGGLNPLIIKSLKNLGDYIKKRNVEFGEDRIIDVEFDLKKRSLIVKDLLYHSDMADSYFTVPLSDEDVVNQFPVLVRISQRIKSRCVFVKRSIDSIKRNYRKARDTSDDILSL